MPKAIRHVIIYLMLGSHIGFNVKPIYSPKIKKIKKSSNPYEN